MLSKVKGYLRCGKVLQVKGEKDLAMKLYERGLRKVKIGTDNDRTVCENNSYFDVY
jgi:F-box/TPR repeat protein Pof3